MLNSSHSLMAGPQYDSLQPVGPLGMFGRKLAKSGQDFGRGLSKKWKQTGYQSGVDKAYGAASNATSELASSASQTFQKSGSADVFKGTAAAAMGVVGTGRALYGTARLAGHGIGAVKGAVSAVGGAVNSLQTLSPRPAANF